MGPPPAGSALSGVVVRAGIGMSHPAQAVTKSQGKVTLMCWGFWVLAVF